MHIIVIYKNAENIIILLLYEFIKIKYNLNKRIIKKNFIKYIKVFKKLKINIKAKLLIYIYTYI